MVRISEDQLIIPALKLLDKLGTLTTTELINLLRKELKPTGEDTKILDNRNDDKFSQKVRNLKSHNTFKNLATYTPPKDREKSGSFTITEQGKEYIKDK